MKKTATKPNPKGRTVIVHKHAGSGAFTVVRDGGRLVSREAKGCEQRAAVHAPARPAAVAYDAEDIEEANRIGAALCRQHAR